MASYRIEKNAQYNSNEIYFESKPAAEVLTALRGLKMRWNPKKGCWYGFAAQDDILAAIGEHDNELGGTISEGYLGATRWDGNKSGKYLYGAELSKAIREELKAQGIKGVSVSCKTFSGGQHITVKVKTMADDFAEDTADGYTEAFRAKLDRINAVLDAYNYDDTNSMVDYFDTNFYRTIKVMAA